MFHIYEGFHLVETYHKMRHQRKYNPDTKRAVKIALVALVTLLLWNMPTAACYRHLCFCHTDVDTRDCFIMGYFYCHHGTDAAFLYG